MNVTTIGAPTEDLPPAAEFVAHLRARRRAALAIFGSILAFAMVIAALLPPRFHAVATLVILPAPEFTVREEAGAHAMNMSALALDQIMKAETEILESDALHTRTLADIGVGVVYPRLREGAAAPMWQAIVRGCVHTLLSPWRASPSDAEAARQDNALRAFADDLTVLPSKESNIITVTFGHKSGDVAARVVNTMLIQYADQRGALYTDPQLAVVRGEADRLAASVREADLALFTYKLAHQISDSAAERGLLLHRLSDTAQEITEARAQIAEQAARRDALDHEMRGLPRDVGLYQEQDTDLRLQAMDANLVDLHAHIDEARVHYREGSRRITGLMAQLRAREGERARMAKASVPSVLRHGRNPSFDPLLVDRARATTETLGAAARHAVLQRELTDIQASLRTLDQQETELALLTQRKAIADANLANASHVLAEQRLTEAEDRLRMAKVRLIQPARTPQRPSPVPILICVAGLLFSALASFAWLMLRFALRPTFLTEEGLEFATGLPVLGVLPVAAAHYQEMAA
jgi:uncharacterized protein involved in exopolysaccharide biosynthesis